MIRKDLQHFLAWPGVAVHPNQDERRERKNPPGTVYKLDEVEPAMAH